MGRTITPQVRLQLTGSVGSLAADSSTREVSVSLLQGYVRGEYGLLRNGEIIPVVSVGAGGFPIKSDDSRHLVWHTSFFWLAGVGFDARLGRSAIFEVRAETQHLNEMSTPYVNAWGRSPSSKTGFRLSP